MFRLPSTSESDADSDGHIASGQVLATADANMLQLSGLLSPPNSTGGSRRIHKRRLNRSSDDEYSTISLSITHDSPQAHDAFTTIPVVLISRESLEYLGLSEQRSRELWEEWTSWPATGPKREVDADDGGLRVTFHDFILGHFDNMQTAHGEDDDLWRQSLTSCGMSQDVQDAIMDPAFKEIRSTANSMYWVKDTIDMRYAGLKDIQRASRARSMVQARGSGRHPRAESTANMSLGAASTAGHARGSRSVSGLQQEATPGVSSTQWTRDFIIHLPTGNESIVLYKGIDQGRTTGFLDDQGQVVDISRILTTPPSDFGGTQSLFYFTNDRNVAEYYAAYAKRRVNCESVVMIVLTIPQKKIDELHNEGESETNSNNIMRAYRLYYPSPQWKQLVWRSKRSQPLPRPLRKYRDALLLVGSTSKGATNAYQDMEHWENVDGNCVLRLAGPDGRMKDAVQYVFSGEEEGHQFLVEQNIQVFPFSAEEVARVQL